MRLWSLHPKYLDSKGLVALWRESLLAKAVLNGQSKGYRHHPQMIRFQSHAMPLRAIDGYLLGIYHEAAKRGFRFDRTKIGPVDVEPAKIPVSTGQMEFEWAHLLAKLAARSPAICEKHRGLNAPLCHPAFSIRPGGIEGWERTK